MYMSIIEVFTRLVFRSAIGSENSTTTSPLDVISLMRAVILSTIFSG